MIRAWRGTSYQRQKGVPEEGRGWQIGERSPTYRPHSRGPYLEQAFLFATAGMFPCSIECRKA